MKKIYQNYKAATIPGEGFVEYYLKRESPDWVKVLLSIVLLSFALWLFYDPRRLIVMFKWAILLQLAIGLKFLLSKLLARLFRQ